MARRMTSLPSWEVVNSKAPAEVAIQIRPLHSRLYSVRKKKVGELSTQRKERLVCVKSRTHCLNFASSASISRFRSLSASFLSSSTESRNEISSSSRLLN